jgi:TonB family protein
MRTLLVFLSFALLTLHAQNDAASWINQGAQAFRTARYDEAAAAFQKALDLEPNHIQARLYLAACYMNQYVPGATSPENLDKAWKAEAEFQRVLSLDANNKVALASLAALALHQMRGQERKADEARGWYNRLLSIDPANAEAWYSLGYLAWAQWYPAYTAARTQLGMRMEQPGPFPEGVVKQDLKGRYEGLIEDGISSLRKALELNPRYDDAMAYMNLLIRQRADLRATTAEYTREIAEADDWVRKALETKKQKAQMAQAGATPPQEGSSPGQIKISEDVQHRKLVRQVQPVYPPQARQARISGSVRLAVTIRKDGSVADIRVISGHPLLVPGALEAVRQWVYQPTLLNGVPVEVSTQVTLYFAPESPDLLQRQPG